MCDGFITLIELDSNYELKGLGECEPGQSNDARTYFKYGWAVCSYGLLEQSEIEWRARNANEKRQKSHAMDFDVVKEKSERTKQATLPHPLRYLYCKVSMRVDLEKRLRCIRWSPVYHQNTVSGFHY